MASFYWTCGLFGTGGVLALELIPFLDSRKARYIARALYLSSFGYLLYMYGDRLFV